MSITDVILTSIVSSKSTTDFPYAKVLIPIVSPLKIVFPIPLSPKNWVKLLDVYELTPTVSVSYTHLRAHET